MNKTLILLTCCAVTVLSSCSGSGSGSSSDTTANLSPTANDNRTGTDTLGTTSPAVSSGYSGPGKDLIAKSDCLGCHTENEKLVGPAYSEVAKKYENNAKNIGDLAGKILKGGSGVWGDVPMTAHPALSEADAKEMAGYILSLK